jgi:hypothetical protein
MKKIMTSTIVASVIAMGTAFAGEISPAFDDTGFDVNGKVELASDILYRGISITDEDAGVYADVRVGYKDTNYGEGYVGVSGRSSDLSPLMTYKVGYDNLWKFEGSSLPLYTQVEYRWTDFQKGNEIEEIPNDDNFETTYAKIGTNYTFVGYGTLGVYLSGEWTTNDPKDFVMEDRYGVEADYLIPDTKIGAFKFEANYFTQDQWGDSYGVSVANQLKKDLWLSVGYQGFEADDDFAGYGGYEDQDYGIVKLSYNF